MSEPSKLQAAAAACAVAMAAIGVTALAADIGVGSTLAWHLIANAAVFAAAARAPLGERIGRRPLLGFLAILLLRLLLMTFGLLDLILGGMALFEGRLDVLWVGLLLVPGVLGFILSLSSASSDDEPDEEDASGNEQAARRLIPRVIVGSATGRPAPLATFLSYVVRAAVNAVWLSLTILLLALSIFYWRNMSDSIFTGENLSLEEWLSILFGMLWRMLPIFVAVPAVYVFIDLITGAVKAFDEWRLLGEGPRTERELSEAEVKYIGDTVAALDFYLQEKKYPNAYGFAYWFGFVAVVGVLALGGYGLFQILPGAWEYLKEVRTAGTTTLYYSGGAPAGALVMSVFAAIFLVWAVFQAAIFVAPDFAEYMYAREGWNSTTPRAREAVEFTPFVVRQLRAGALRPDKQPDPPALIRAAFRQHEAVIFGGTSFLWLIVAVLCYLDVSSYRRFTEDKITYSDYWTASQIEIPYSAVDRVETSCSIDKDSETSVGYYVYFDRTHGDDLIGTSKLKEDILAAIPIDEKLRAAGVKAGPATTPNIADRVPRFEQDCLDRLKADLGEEVYAKAARLLRADSALKSPE